MSDFRLQAISFKKHSGGDSFGPAQGVKKTNKICPHGHEELLICSLSGSCGEK